MKIKKLTQQSLDTINKSKDFLSKKQLVPFKQSILQLKSELSNLGLELLRIKDKKLIQKINDSSIKVFLSILKGI